MILGILNQKGGCGKSTLAVNMAAVYAQQRLRVLLVDADPQGSAMAWSAARVPSGRARSTPAQQCSLF